MAQERLGNLGYLALIKEATKGIPLNPGSGDFIPLYSESLTTDINLVEDNPVVGVKFARYQTVQGQRAHKGDFEIMAEPNTIARILDMFLTQGSQSGSGPFTYPFTLSASSNPKSYTIDISSGNIVSRFWGVEASKLTPKWDKNELRMQVGVSALGSFQGRQISSVTGAGPYTVNLDTTYDPSPTTGLVVGDLIRFYHNGTTIDATVATIPGATSITTVTNVSTMVAGDYVYLRPATPTYTLLSPFQWAKTQFCFGATASAALSAAQTRLEVGSGWTLDHKFESADGSLRSGAYDPASLVRTQGDASFKYRKFFDTPEEMQQFQMMSKTAVVIRHYAGATNQYELRVTLNNIRPKTNPKPKLESAKILYEDIDMLPVYDQSDAQGFSVTVINNLATV